MKKILIIFIVGLVKYSFFIGALIFYGVVLFVLTGTVDYRPEIVKATRYNPKDVTYYLMDIWSIIHAFSYIFGILILFGITYYFDKVHKKYKKMLWD
jgi:hypothetical protein